jgi:hypothetical protein
MPNLIRCGSSIQQFFNNLQAGADPQAYKIKFKGFVNFSYCVGVNRFSVDHQGKPLQILPHQVAFLNQLKTNHKQSEPFPSQFIDGHGRFYKSPTFYEENRVVSWPEDDSFEKGMARAINVNITYKVSWFDEYGTQRSFTVTEYYSGIPQPR